MKKKDGSRVVDEEAPAPMSRSRYSEHSSEAIDACPLQGCIGKQIMVQKSTRNQHEWKL